MGSGGRAKNFLNPKRARAASHNAEPRAAYGNTSAGYWVALSATHETTRLRSTGHHFHDARHRDQYFDLSFGRYGLAAAARGERTVTIGRALRNNPQRRGMVAAILSELQRVPRS